MSASSPLAAEAPSAVAGWILIASTLATISAVAFHPIAQGEDLTEILRSIIVGSLRDEIVHGTILAAVLGSLFGILALAARLGSSRPTVRFGMIVYAAGSAAEAGAALLDGFVTPQYAAHLLASAPEEPRIGLGALFLISVLIQCLTKLGLVLISAGILAFSAALPRRGLRALLAVWLGIPAGLLPVAWLFVTNPMLGPHLLLGLVLLEAFWSLAVAGILLETPSRAQPS